MKLKQTHTPDIEQFMLSRGLDRLVLANKKMVVDIEQAVTPFKPQIVDVKSKTIGPAKQLSVVTNLYNNPLKDKGVYVLNSFPSDLRAKVVASCIMAKACEAYRGIELRKRQGRSAPKWFRVLGGWSEREHTMLKEERPALLILSNITTESSPSKVEKLRDILDIMDDIPRIVVVGGDDPVSFFAKRVHYPINGAVRLGSNEKVNLMDI